MTTITAMAYNAGIKVFTSANCHYCKKTHLLSVHVNYKNLCNENNKKLYNK